jgi:hypothetical protein
MKDEELKKEERGKRKEDGQRILDKGERGTKILKRRKTRRRDQRIVT